jgi:Ca2+-binding RTX toxin-like protein
LIGSSGDDTYRFGLGDGQDVVRDYGDWWNGSGGNDKVEFGAGIAPADVIVTQSNGGNDLVLGIAGTTNTITLVGTVTDSAYRIEQITFVDGTTWSHADLMTRALAGTAGNDTLWGSYDNDTIGGGAGNDTIVGCGGNDTIRARSGADTLTGGSGAEFSPSRTGTPASARMRIASRISRGESTGSI